MEQKIKFDEDILKLMTGNNDAYMVRRVAEFMSQKGEKITYNKKPDESGLKISDSFNKCLEI